jgi:hypothetical protein
LPDEIIQEVTRLIIYNLKETQDACSKIEWEMGRRYFPMGEEPFLEMDGPAFVGSQILF